jgi:putative aldouronate transport system permease protein
MKKKFSIGTALIHLFFIVTCLTFIIPMIYVLSISFSSEKAISDFGYSIIPKVWSLDAYKHIFRNPDQVIYSYQTTIFFSLVGSFASLLVMALVAYPLSRQNFKLRQPITFFIFFTMLFGGGLIPTYILNTQYLHLGNTIWIYILPGLASAWYIIIIRTFFSQLPQSLVESAKVDGAKELRIFFQIVLPLSKPVLATVLLMTLLAKWNDWYTSLIYIRDSKLYSLQYMLQKMLREAEFVKGLSNSQMGLNIQLETEVPTESVRFAMVIVAAGPMLVVFPFFQKYFTRGLTVGAVKG